MPNKHANRAQIFQPFDSLKGLHELLRLQEEVKVPRRILSEDDYEKLNREIHRVQKGMIVRIVYYNGKHYIQKEGKVAKINLDMRMIQVVQEKISLDSITEVEVIS